MLDSIKNQAAFFKRPNFLFSLLRVKKHVYTDVLKLDAEFATTKEPVPYAERKALSYAKIEQGEVWATEQFDCGWFHFTGKLNCPTENLFGIFAFEAEACVFDDNGVVQGLTNVLSTGDMFQPTRGKQIVEASKLNIDKDGNVDVWVETGKNGAIMQIKGGASHLKRAVIARRRDDVYELYFDLLVLQQYANALKKCPEKTAINSAVHKAFSVLSDFSEENVQAARDILAPFYAGGNDNPFEITAVGHAHLDLAWLWPLRESHRKAERTYSNALYEIEKHDDYVFGSSQPQQFEWIKDARPSLYAKIKDAIANGRIEPQGVMWVEPDTNVPSGESLIRQCYYGKNYFRDEFGVEMDYLWVPDVFGYTAALPRILNGVGVDKFMTIKLSWNNINKFPHHSFWWKGIGDGKVLVHMPPEGDYNSQCNPFVTQKIETNYRERAVSNVSLMPFGCGDGGGGPGEYHVQSIERQSKIKYNLMPRIKFGSANEFFKKLEAEKDKLPTHEGELYLEKHQGTYTTQSVMKRDMRRAERLLHDAEFLCTLAMLRGAEYPNEKLDRIWKNTLLHQFHDILPGSSINRVYKEAHPCFIEQEAELLSLQNDAVRFLNGQAKYVVNDISFARKGYVKYENGWYSYDAKPYATAELKPLSGGAVKSNGNILENDKIRSTFNDNGEITELLDKNANVNAVGKAFNSLRVYTDSKMVPYDAWDINIKYTKKPSALMKLTDVKCYVDGARAVREQTFSYGSSTLTQKAYVYPDNPCVYFENSVEWHESHKMLRADFLPSHFSDKVKCDIQMGSIDRSTKTETSVEYAQFEVCAHKWVDVSDDNYGVAVMNDCKYGHRVKNGLISLNLLRSPTYPDKTADRGKHEFTYAVYPHAGATLESDLIKYAYDLNYPVKVIETEAFSSVIECDNEDVIVETVMSDGRGNVAVRLYESKGRAQSASVKAGFNYKGVQAVNLILENPTDIDVSKMEFTPFEIKTLLFTR